MSEFVFDQFLNRCQGSNKERHSAQCIRSFSRCLEACGVCSFPSTMAWVITNAEENCGKHSRAACCALCALWMNHKCSFCCVQKNRAGNCDPIRSKVCTSERQQCCRAVPTDWPHRVRPEELSLHALCYGVCAGWDCWSAFFFQRIHLALVAGLCSLACI